ncbi:nickel-dependent hydrogenase large subunit [Patescibacteria group bacterium]|nr:nickel-dependent hydrogenase large subunit [Patescibacteria group bacterium]MBU1931109.1 nickel-dependent hydrogenase large subunit [Patescibacteria group bacterium]
MAKTKIAVFDLTGCDGCQFHLMSLNELLLDLFQDFEINYWRLLTEPSKIDCDIAIIEGAVTTEEHIKLLKEIRQTSKVVIAIGACALNGNVFAQIPQKQRAKLAAKIYDANYQLKAKFLEPVAKFIQVDEQVSGCPPNIEDFKKILAKYQKEPVVSALKTVTVPDYVAKIEGHGILKINFKTQQASFQVEESERLIEGLLIGKKFQQAPFINARICGICPVAHNLCSWAAIENAYQVQPLLAVINLRKLLLAAQTIKSHVLHLFFLVLPDYAQVKGGIELATKYPAEFHLMLNIKRTADRTMEIVGGSSAFPTTTILGGFAQMPDLIELKKISQSIEEILDEAEDLVKLFASLKIPSLTTQTRLLTTNPVSGQYPLYPGSLNTTIKESVQSKSTAKLGILADGTVIKVGALARLSSYADNLHSQAKELWQQHPVDPHNPFDNNLAQAIEVLHFLEEIQLLVEDLTKTDLNQTIGLKTPPSLKQAVSGQAALEAPRGVLIHQVTLEPDGTIQNYNIIPPTQINLASLNHEAQILAQQSQTQTNLKKSAEQLIRAFDPCITCAVH